MLEYRIDFGPGYRVYMGRDGDALVVLLAGGAKETATAAYPDGRGVIEGLPAEQAQQAMSGDA